MFNMPLCQKLIAFKLGTTGMLQHVFISPCGRYVICRALEVSHQIYRLFVVDFGFYFEKLREDVEFAQLVFSGSSQVPFGPDYVLLYEFLREFREPDRYIYKMMAQTYAYGPELQSTSAVIQSHCDVYQLRLDLKNGDVELRSVLDSSLTMDPALFKSLQDVMLIKQKFLLLQFSSTLVLL